MAHSSLADSGNQRRSNPDPRALEDEDVAHSPAHALNDSIRILHHLQQLLEHEYQALATLDSAALQAISDEKQSLVDILTAEHQKWQETGIIPANSAVVETSATHSDTKAASSRTQSRSQHWQEVRDCLTRIQRQNKINGSIIALSDGYTRDLLNILTGNLSATGLYNADGTATTGTHGRLLGEM